MEWAGPHIIFQALRFVLIIAGVAALSWVIRRLFRAPIEGPRFTVKDWGALGALVGVLFFLIHNPWFESFRHRHIAADGNYDVQYNLAILLGGLVVVPVILLVWAIIFYKKDKATPKA